MAVLDFFLFDVDKLLVWVSKFNPTRILSAICKAGVEVWNHFRKWFFGLNFDKHEWAIDAFMPILPQFTSDMEEVVRRQTAENRAVRLEECLELDLATEEYDNEQIWEESEDGVRRMVLKNARRQVKKIKAGMVEAAIAAVEARIRNRHMIYGDDMNIIDEAAVRATALDICGEFKINEHCTKTLIYAAAYRAMTPDQASVDAVKMAYNPKSQARRTLVSVVRKNVSFGGFKSLEDF